MSYPTVMGLKGALCKSLGDRREVQTRSGIGLIWNFLFSTLIASLRFSWSHQKNVTGHIF